MADFANTGEKWITDNNVEACGGRIDLVNVGFIDFYPVLEHRIRKVVGRPVLPSATTDEKVWRIVGDQWLLKDEIV